MTPSVRDMETTNNTAATMNTNDTIFEMRTAVRDLTSMDEGSRVIAAFALGKLAMMGSEIAAVSMNDVRYGSPKEIQALINEIAAELAAKEAA